jgi:hypothetical protein
MIFNKEFITENFEEKVREMLHKAHPYQTLFKQGEKSPYETYIQNYFTFYDLESEKMKDKKYLANLEISENCYKPDYLDIYPNTSKINQCIKDIDAKHLGKYDLKRDVFFGNGIVLLIQSSVTIMKVLQTAPLIIFNALRSRLKDSFGISIKLSTFSRRSSLNKFK